MMCLAKFFVASALLLATPMAAQAQAGDEVIVTGATISESQGRIAINVADGNDNQQAASAVIAVGSEGIATNGVHQHGNSHLSLVGPAHAEIKAGTLSGVQGMISINVAAGNQNQEANLAVIALALGGSALTDNLLSQTRSPPSEQSVQAGPSQRSGDAAILSPDALTGSHGLIQINLVAGERNSSANTFALNLSGGGL